MFARLVRLTILAAVVAAVVAAIRALTRDDDPLPAPAPAPSAPWPPLRDTGQAATGAPRDDADDTGDAPEASVSESAAAWVEPGSDGSCPDGYPIKAKLSSKIFHAPGQMNYERTAPDRCYADAAAAEADGLRAAKR